MQSVQQLYNASSDTQAALIAKCKGESKAIAARFDGLHTQSATYMKRGEDVGAPVIRLLERD
jgi:hypothetical protein